MLENNFIVTAAAERAKHRLEEYKKHLEIALKIERQGIRFLGNRVVIVLDTASNLTASGLEMPETAIRAKPATGTIVGVGKVMVEATSDEAYAVECGIKIGERIACSKYGGTDIELYLDGPAKESTHVQLLPVGDIYAIWSPAEGAELPTNG